MKKIIKFFLVFFLSFLAIFYRQDQINIVLTIPLLAFFMFNGIQSFIVSLIGLLIGSIYSFYIYQSYLSIVYLLIGLCAYFLLYHLLLLFNKKLIINYIVSAIIAIVISYIIYAISNDDFHLIKATIVLLKSCIICLLFAFLLKNYSFYLHVYNDEYSPIIIVSLILVYLSQFYVILPTIIGKYITLFLLLLTSLIFTLKNKTTFVLCFNSAILLLGYIFSIEFLYKYVYIILPTTVCLSINKSNKNIFNSLLSLSCFIVLYFIFKDDNLVYYCIMSFSICFILLFIKKKTFVLKTNEYYNQYIKNREEMLYQLKNFQSLFTYMSNSFKNARQNRILTKAKEEVFDKLCFNCSKADICHKKGKHLLLNYIKDYINDELDEDSIRYIKHNCLKQEAYFTLLDKFTKHYLLNNYKKEEESKMKEIIAADFYSFSMVMEQCCISFNNDKLLLANHFYKKLDSILKDYHFDILFVNNHSCDDYYQFDVAIKNIKVKEINELLLPLIDEALQTNMEIIQVHNATLSSSYYILTIKEKENLSIDFAIKQSNEDIKANGDSYSSLYTSKLFFFAIADGMGNGMDANEESKFALDSLFSLLKTNMDIKSSLHITNDIIQLKNDFESYTTIDLLAIDRKKKIASFYKLGAFNAYIIRDHQVTEINNFSLPIGILDSINPTASSFKIEKNDVIIMCSDGMIDDTNSKINSILEDITYDNASIIVNSLFSHLIEIRKNDDDATLAVITIH